MFKIRTYCACTFILFFFGVENVPAYYTGEKGTSPESKVRVNKINSAERNTSDFAFAENKGQVIGHDGLRHPEVKFNLQQDNITFYLLDDGIAYQFNKVHYPDWYKEMQQKKFDPFDSEKQKRLESEIRIETFRMDLILKGANKHAKISKEEQSNGYTNYYNYDAISVYSYQRVIYHDIYPGIDWIIQAKDNHIKYDFRVHPGADPTVIRMECKHQEKTLLSKDGSIQMINCLGSIREMAPVSFQGERIVATRFKLEGNTISFLLDNYDDNEMLLIDPSLIWATYYGGPNNEQGFYTTADNQGNIYSAGFTESLSNIASGGHQNTYGTNTDAFLVKFNNQGIRLWASYYGGDGLDYATTCCTDSAGNVYLAGATNSGGDIASGGHQNVFGSGNRDAFIVKFNSQGQRQWASYYGGTASDAGYSCTTDNFGNLYLAGVTNSTNNISSGGHLNNYLGGTSAAFLVKFNSQGTRLWASYYGGINEEIGYSCTSDAFGNVYLAGNTTATSGISSGGFQNNFGGGFNDAFLVKFNAAGQRLWATYYGDTGWEFGYSCAADNESNIYLAGATQSTTGIASGGHQMNYGGDLYDAFIVKFNTLGQRQWASYYGGEGQEMGRACITDASGNVFLTGETTSTSNIASAGYQNSLSGLYDGFLVEFDKFGIRQWGSYFGAGNFDFSNHCSTDRFGNVYIIGSTSSSANIASGGHQNVFAGGVADAFIVKYCYAQPSQIPTIAGNTLICTGASQVYSVALNPGVMSYSWVLPGSWSGTSTTNSISVIAGNNGVLTLISQYACAAGTTQSLNVSVDPCAEVAEKNVEAEQILIFPNPNQGEIFIETISILNLSVYNSLGQLIFEQEMPTGKNRIDISNLNNGVYLVKMLQNGRSFINRIVKEE